MTEPVTILVASSIELAKLGLQIYFASARQSGLTDAELNSLLESERNRFEKNSNVPLPDV
jgi:hypothetical protein